MFHPPTPSSDTDNEDTLLQSPASDTGSVNTLLASPSSPLTPIQQNQIQVQRGLLVNVLPLVYNPLPLTQDNNTPLVPRQHRRNQQDQDQNPSQSPSQSPSQVVKRRLF